MYLSFLLGTECHTAIWDAMKQAVWFPDELRPHEVLRIHAELAGKCSVGCESWWRL